MKIKKQESKIETIRHSLSHIMAYAVLELFPGTKLGIGPAIENGFYYDFQFSGQLSDKDLPRIEDKIKNILKTNIVFKKELITKEETSKLFQNQPYKLELIKELPDEKTIVYKSGKFIDLCKGPHINNTSEIPSDSFKLTKVAGAYWRGSEKNKMLTRIYGVAFENKKKLEEYLKMIGEAERRDHKVLGEKLELFIFSDLVGPGLPIYTFKGTIVLDEIKKYLNQLQVGIGYQEVQTPNMNRAELFKVSGHYDKYKNDMFRVASHYTEEEYYLKPMNCPQHTQIYASKPRSYKDLPIRISDFANLYRDEKTGELSGLTRLRCFRQDDGHCFCMESQIKNEFKSVLSIIKKAMKAFKMDYLIRFSLWDPKHSEKYLGDKEVWEKSQKTMEEILKENKVKYFKAPGEAAIYGPKMDVISKDSLGREWQLSTIQLDFIMPQRFGLKYKDSDGKEKTPVMIHRAIIGSPERFFGVLIEHYAGAFPLWLSPVQVGIINISDAHKKYARLVYDELTTAGIRAELKDDNLTLGKKIREAEMQKIPYILIIGDKEMKTKSVAVRTKGKDLGKIKLKKFLKDVIIEKDERR